MKKTKIFSVILAICMLFSITVSADFPDMPSDEKIANAINSAVANGILSGYEDGTVQAERNITRAEMASIITRVCGASKEADISEFSDVEADKWYYSAFSKAYAMGAFAGDDQRHMNPQNNITFQECFTILSQVFFLYPPFKLIRDDSYDFPDDTIFTPANRRLYDVSVLNNFSDKIQIGEWAKIFVAGVVSNGGWDGEDGRITPTAYITRGQFAVVMNNIIQNYIDTPGTYTEFPEGHTMIRCNDVDLDELKTDYNIYVADCVEQGGIIVNNVTANSLVVRGCVTPIDENENPINDSYGIVISGTFGSIRIMRPYIAADVSGADYNKKLYVAERTDINLGQVIKID